MTAVVSDPARAPRTDGEASRERLLHAGLKLFAQQGFSKTSTRELAEAANVNVASISYYFGDKAGLYRAVSLEAMGSPDDDLARYRDPALTLPQALRGFYLGFTEPLKQGDVARLCMKLHYREMLEPTGLWDDGLAHCIRPMHEQLLGLLRRHLGLPVVDDELRRLALCLAGLAVHMHVGRDLIDELAPALTAAPEAFDLWADRLVMYGLAMVEAERSRRTLPRAGAA